ncbi:MAG: phosphoribosylanthranilate isomerase [Vicinamibacterales bacterium]
MMVKICGVTRSEDAQAAVAAGAQAIGFIFWAGSPRQVSVGQARRITRDVPAFVTTVGVFVNQSLEEIEETAAAAGLSAVQLHGDEDRGFASRLSRPTIKAVSHQLEQAKDWPSSVTLLVDAFDPQRRGGTGQKADWTAAARLARERRIVLAGGLNAENVAAAIRQVRPFGIDVSSGVESAPGLKDHGKIRALFQAVQVL